MLKKIKNQGRNNYQNESLDPDNTEKEEDCFELFDPLGSSETDALKYAEACHFKNGRLLFNKSKVQTENMYSCGAFCVNFVVNRLENPDMCFTDLLEEVFSGSPIKDEIQSIHFLENLEK